jgi:hypothetical protein
MRPIEIHRAWAPTGGTWSPWVKPVLFAAIDEDAESAPIPAAPEWLHSAFEAMTKAQKEPYRESHALRDVAVVIDLPSDEGAKLGVALTEHGFRPIPLYNALPSRVAIVDVRPLMVALAEHAEHVAKVPLTAPPAFLLDANRMGRGRDVRPGRFDNRSTCRASDFPSSDALREAGIRRVLLMTDEVQEDLEPIALAWQAAGLALWRTSGGGAAALTLRESWFGRRLWNERGRSAFGRGAAGAYGALSVAPSTG